MAWFSLVDIHKVLKKLLPEAKDISKESSQGGVYIVFNGIRRVGYGVDEALFVVLVQARSLNDDNTGLFPKLDDIRERLIKSDVFGDLVSDIENLGFENSLYRYAINIRVKIYRSKA